MITFSKIIMLGHLTAPPRFRVVSNEKPVADTTLAVNDAFRRGEEWVETVTYVDVTFFGGLATAVRELPKGTALYCEGRLSSETWDDKKTNQRRFRLKVVAERMRRVPKMVSNTENEASAASPV